MENENRNNSIDLKRLSKIPQKIIEGAKLSKQDPKVLAKIEEFVLLPHTGMNNTQLLYSALREGILSKEMLQLICGYVKGLNYESVLKSLNRELKKDHIFDKTAKNYFIIPGATNELKQG